MNALLLACDTLAVKVVEATNAAAVIVEKTKNCCDVKISETICDAIVTVVVIAAITILLWHLIQKIADGCKHRREIAKEEDEKTLKMKLDYQNKILESMENDINSWKNVSKFISELYEKKDFDSETRNTVVNLLISKYLKESSNNISNEKTVYINTINSFITDLKDKKQS